MSQGAPALVPTSAELSGAEQYHAGAILSALNFTSAGTYFRSTRPTSVTRNNLTGPISLPMELTWGEEYRPSSIPDIASLLGELERGGDADDVQVRNHAALCITDVVRDETGLRSARRHVLDALGADLLLYSSKDRNPVLRRVMKELRPRVFAKAPRDDLTPEQFQADLQPNTAQYMPFGGSVSPLTCNASEGTAQSQVECANALSLYVGQQRCLDMVEAAERARGKRYEWVLWSRGELRWVVDHPPLHLLGKDRVWIPQCSSDFYGVYDRHAAMPRALADTYLSRYRMLKSGEMLSVLQRKRRVESWGDVRLSHNSESMLHGMLAAKGVAVGRFPCVAALTCCEDCFSNACCTVTFRTATGATQTFKVRSPLNPPTAPLSWPSCARASVHGRPSPTGSALQPARAPQQRGRAFGGPMGHRRASRASGRRLRPRARPTAMNGMLRSRARTPPTKRSQTRPRLGSIPSPLFRCARRPASGPQRCSAWSATTLSRSTPCHRPRPRCASAPL